MIDQEVEVCLDNRFKYLGVYDEFDKGELHDLWAEIYDRISYFEGSGYTKVFAKFESTRDPYEDFLGPVEVSIWGYRPRNKVEIQQDKDREEAKKLAKELGTYVTAAEEILRLKKEGKL